MALGRSKNDDTTTIDPVDPSTAWPLWPGGPSVADLADPTSPWHVPDAAVRAHVPAAVRHRSFTADVAGARSGAALDPYVHAEGKPRGLTLEEWVPLKVAVRRARDLAAGEARRAAYRPRTCVACGARYPSPIRPADGGPAVSLCGPCAAVVPAALGQLHTDRVGRVVDALRRARGTA